MKKFIHPRIKLEKIIKSSTNNTIINYKINKINFQNYNTTKQTQNENQKQINEEKTIINKNFFQVWKKYAIRYSIVVAIVGGVSYIIYKFTKWFSALSLHDVGK
jgi:hypothetical protein